jgi:hypothetical protein
VNALFAAYEYWEPFIIWRSKQLESLKLELNSQKPLTRLAIKRLAFCLSFSVATRRKIH